MAESVDEAVRLDVWLWRARFFKTRALAAGHISKRGIRVSRSNQTRKIDKPGAKISAGDILLFSRARQATCVEVVEIGHRRGPAIEAQGLYRQIDVDT